MTAICQFYFFCESVGIARPAPCNGLLADSFELEIVFTVGAIAIFAKLEPREAFTISMFQ